MRAFMALVVVATLLPIPVSADEPTDEVTAELQAWQGLWQTFPGGMEHRDGKQVVRTPAAEGPCFFVAGDRLLWLDETGKPSGKEDKLALDIKADPKRITLTPVEDAKDRKPTYGIYSATDTGLTIHIGLDGGPAPKQFLELNKPQEGVDGRQWLVGRKKLRGK